MKRALGMMLLVLCGCGGEKPTPIVATGAEDAVVDFFGGLTNSDAQRAYGVLDGDSKQRISAAQFSPLAQAYFRKLGYRVKRIHISSCEEREESATAHVVLIGHAAGHLRRFEDAVTLRRRDGRWGIVLPANFGRYPR